MGGFKAIVIVARANSDEMRLRDNIRQRKAIAFAFETYGPALVLMRTSKVDTVLVEFETSAMLQKPSKSQSYFLQTS